MSRISEYDKFPTVPVQDTPNCVWQGWNAILEYIRAQISKRARRIAIECYPGVFEDEAAAGLSDGLKSV